MTSMSSDGESVRKLIADVDDELFPGRDKLSEAEVEEVAAEVARRTPPDRQQYFYREVLTPMVASAKLIEGAFSDIERFPDDL